MASATQEVLITPRTYTRLRNLATHKQFMRGFRYIPQHECYAIEVGWMVLSALRHRQQEHGFRTLNDTIAHLLDLEGV